MPSSPGFTYRSWLLVYAPFVTWCFVAFALVSLWTDLGQQLALVSRYCLEDDDRTDQGADCAGDSKCAKSYGNAVFLVNQTFRVSWLLLAVLLLLPLGNAWLLARLETQERNAAFLEQVIQEQQRKKQAQQEKTE